MRESKTVNVDDVEYCFNLLNTTKALDIFVDVVQVAGPTVGPILSDLFSGKRASLLDANLKEIDFDAAVRGFVGALNKQQIASIMKDLATVTTVVGHGPLAKLYELHFSTHGVMHQLKWFAEALKFQYSDFWDALQWMLSEVNSKAPSETSDSE